MQMQNTNIQLLKGDDSLSDDSPGVFSLKNSIQDGAKLLQSNKCHMPSGGLNVCCREALIKRRFLAERL